MKKISYFGKEYVVGDDIKWVATCSSGNVIAFTEMPKIFRGTWVVEVGTRIDICGSASANWKNSLRKVEDIIVKENELKVGDKVMVNENINGFKKGQIVELYRLERDGCHLFKGDNYAYNHCDGYQGAYLIRDTYTITSDTKSHPHADLMLKYAMIAQYDDKPWECFECDFGGGGWVGMIGSLFHDGYNYRLKPQEPKIQVGQIWVSKEGVEGTVSVIYKDGSVLLSFYIGGIDLSWTFSERSLFNGFKRKE